MRDGTLFTASLFTLSKRSTHPNTNTKYSIVNTQSRNTVVYITIKYYALYGIVCAILSSDWRCSGFVYTSMARNTAAMPGTVTM